MIKKVINYHDYNGNPKTKEFYFNLSKAEVAQLDLVTPGGLQAMLERISTEQDGEKILEIFKFFILNSYGVKSPDGERFIKSQEMRDAFEQTDAYSELFMEMMSDSEAAVAFIKGVIPQPKQEVVS